jgi:hypothetical protein
MGDASNILWKMTRSHMTDCTRRRISPRRLTNERLWVEALHPSRASPIEFFTYPTHSAWERSDTHQLQFTQGDGFREGLNPSDAMSMATSPIVVARLAASAKASARQHRQASAKPWRVAGTGRPQYAADSRLCRCRLWDTGSPGRRRAEATPSFGRLCRATTGGSEIGSRAPSPIPSPAPRFRARHRR